jgi:hypothetical protein
MDTVVPTCHTPHNVVSLARQGLVVCCPFHCSPRSPSYCQYQLLMWAAVLTCAVLCCAVLTCAVLRCAVLFHDVPCCAVLWCAVLFYYLA